MTFAELKNIRQDNNKNCSRSKLSRVLCNIVSHGLARKIIFSLPVRNCTIFAQACVEDLIFLLKWLMLIFNFCVSTVSIVERVINKTKPSFMQICVYLISFVRGMQDVYQHRIWRLAHNCNHSINSGDQPGGLGDLLVMVRRPENFPRAQPWINIILTTIWEKKSGNARSITSYFTSTI